MDANIGRTADERTGRVSALLHEELPASTAGLTTALRRAEVCYIGIVESKAKAHQVLLERRMQYRHPKDKEYTDFDRTILLEGNTADCQADYELLAGIEKALEQRIAVIQTLLQP